MMHYLNHISSWGGLSESELHNVFSAQKRCVLLFGKRFSFDHTGSGYYQIWGRVRSYSYGAALHSCEQYKRGYLKAVKNRGCSPCSLGRFKILTLLMRNLTIELHILYNAHILYNIVPE